MGLITRYINKKQKEAELWPVDLETIDKYNHKLLVGISLLDELLIELRDCRRKNQIEERKELCDRIVYHLTAINHNLNAFAREYKKIQHANECYNSIPPHIADICLAYNIEVKMNIINENKQHLRAEFERIYTHFKKTAKGLKTSTGLKDIPMNYILNLMRKYFDFNNQMFNNTQENSSIKDRFVSVADVLKEIK